MNTMIHERLSKQQLEILAQNELHGSDGNWLQSQKFLKERTKQVIDNLKALQKEINKELKPYKVSLKLSSNSKDEHPHIYLSWNRNFTPPYPDGTRHKTETIVRKLTDLTKREMKASPETLALAKQHAIAFANSVRMGTFKWEDYYFWLPRHLQKEYEQKNRVKTIGELIAEFEEWFWAQRDKRDKEQVRKGEKTYHEHYYIDVFRHLQDKLDQPLTQSVIKEVIEYYPSNTYGRHSICIRLKTFLKHTSSNIDFDFEQYKQSRKYKKKTRVIPSDEEIDNLMMNFPYKRKGKRVFQYRWLLGVMAIYGLRNHEVLKIKNLHEPYTYIDKNGKGITLPAFMDKSIKTPIIYIEGGKTGKRIQALPLCAEWIDKWGLRDIENPPTWNNLGCIPESFVHNIALCLREQNIAFTPYSLRHAYAHRCERLGIAPLTAATAMGHTPEMHTSIYHSNKSDKEKIELANQLLREVKEQEQVEKSKDKEIEELKWEVRKLKQELEKKDLEYHKAIQRIVELEGLTRV